MLPSFSKHSTALSIYSKLGTSTSFLILYSQSTYYLKLQSEINEAVKSNKHNK